MRLEYDAVDVIKNSIEEKGITLTFISKNVGIDVDVLSRCLRHKRVLRGNELIVLADFLNLEISDFKKQAKSA